MLSRLASAGTLWLLEVHMLPSATREAPVSVVRHMTYSLVNQTSI